MIEVGKELMALSSHGKDNSFKLHDKFSDILLLFHKDEPMKAIFEFLFWYQSFFFKISTHLISYLSVPNRGISYKTPIL